MRRLDGQEDRRSMHLVALGVDIGGRIRRTSHWGIEENGNPGLGRKGTCPG